MDGRGERRLGLWIVVSNEKKEEEMMVVVMNGVCKDKRQHR